MSTDTSLEDLVAQEQAAGDPPQDETTETTPPAESAESQAEAEPNGDEAPEEPGPDVDQQLQRLEELTGYRLSDRYTSYDEAVRGLGNAVKMLGQRDEDAQFGKTIREKYGDQERIAQLLAKTETPSQDIDTTTGLPESYEALMAMQEAARLRMEKPGYETDPVYQRGVEATRVLAKQTFDAVRHYGAIQDEMAQLREQLKTAQQSTELSSAQQAEQGWWAARHAEMCQDGDWSKLTPLAKRTIEIAQSDEDCAALAQGRGPQAALEVARAKALASQPKPKRTKPVSPNAVHQPGVKSSEHRAASAEELLDSGLEGEALLKALHEQATAK